MNLPGVVVDLPTLTDKDKEDLVQWGVKNKVDFIAASFVRKGMDLDNIRDVLGEAGADIHIISKIENQEGIQNFEVILEKSDGVMVRAVCSGGWGVVPWRCCKVVRSCSSCARCAALHAQPPPTGGAGVQEEWGGLCCVLRGWPCGCRAGAALMHGARVLPAPHACTTARMLVSKSRGSMRHTHAAPAGSQGQAAAGHVTHGGR